MTIVIYEYKNYQTNEICVFSTNDSILKKRENNNTF